MGKIVLSHPSANGEARKIAEKIGGKCGSVVWKKFKDGWPDLFIEKVKTLRDADVTFVAVMRDLKIVFEQVAVIFALPKYSVRSLNVEILGLPPASKYTNRDTVSYRDALLRMLAWVPNTKCGPVRFSFSDPQCKASVLLAKILEKREGAANRERNDTDVSKRFPLIFFAPAQERMGLEIIQRLGYEEGVTVVEHGFEEEGLVMRTDPSNFENRDVVFIASFDTPEDCIKQLALLYHIAERNIRSLRVVLPYFPVGTMERVDVEGQIATAKTMARLISAIPMAQGQNATEVTIFDMHALQERFYFEDTIIPNLVSAMPALLKASFRRKGAYVLVFPDDGAYKRYKNEVEGWPIVICNKVRLGGDKKKVVIKDGDPRGKHAIILDDLMQSCVTLTECRDVIVDAGALSVSVRVPHAVTPKEAWKRLESELFDEVVVTDSNPLIIKQITGVKPFKVVPLAPLIIELL